MRRFRFLALMLAFAVLASCSDKEPVSPPNFQITSAPSVDEQITKLFPTGLQASARARWTTIQRHLARRESALAKKKALQLIGWTKQKYDAGALLDPNGPLAPTPETAVGVFAATVFGITHPELPPPPTDVLEEGGALAVIDASGGDVIGEESAVSFEPGTFNTEVLVVLDPIPATEPPGQGPLDTPSPQYPSFVHISTYPNTPVGVAARIGLCYELDGPYAPPGRSIAALRVGHQVSTVPPIVDVLARVDVDDILDCGHHEVIGVPQRLGALHKGLRMLSRAASGAVGVFTPRPLYALHVGVGGELSIGEDFSPFGIIDPSSHNTASVCGTINPNDPSSFDNVPDALAYVDAGGFVGVCGGEYTVADVYIRKSVTIGPNEEARPVFNVPSGSTAGFIIDDVVGGGPVEIRDFQFNVAGYSAVSVARFAGELTVPANYELVRFIDNYVDIGEGGSTGLFAYQSSVPGGKVVFQYNRVTGGQSGVFAVTAEVETRNNTFTGQTFSGIQYQQQARGIVDWNQVSECGPYGCIRLRLSHSLTVTRNTISSTEGRGTMYGILSDTGAVTIEDNTVTGISPVPDFFNHAFDSAGIQVGLVHNQDGSVVRRNTVTNAGSGIVARHAQISGSDNVITNVLYGFNGLLDGVMSMNANDVTDAYYAWGDLDERSNVTCNWWGSIYGPSSYNGFPNFVPWATAAIANEAGGLCDGYPIIGGAKKQQASARAQLAPLTMKDLQSSSSKIAGLPTRFPGIVLY